jgi:hypothetical protein
MRNLYKRLSSDRWAPQETLKESINNCRDKSLQQDAECVFSNPKSRKLYDHTHSALVGISQLRNGLGLTHKELWNNQLNTEFNDGKTSPLRLHELIQTTSTKSQNRPVRTKQESNGIMSWTDLMRCLGSVIAASFVAFLLFGNWDETSSNQQTTSHTSTYQTPALSPRNTFNEPAVSPPAHGDTRRHLDVDAVAPLEINTSYGGYYFIKMVDTSSGREELELFIHGGRTIEIKMPLGTYTMKYATGKTWYGREHLFGLDTVYSEASSSFDFTQDYSGYSGYTVTLYKVSNGNMQTKSINASQF